jgi:hypothetical protein
MSQLTLPDWWLKRDLCAVGADWHSDRRLAIAAGLPDGLEPETRRAEDIGRWLAEMLPGTPAKIRASVPFVDSMGTLQWTVEPRQDLVRAQYVALVEELFPRCHWVAGDPDCGCYGQVPPHTFDPYETAWPLIAIQAGKPVAMLATIGRYSNPWQS